MANSSDARGPETSPPPLPEAEQLIVARRRVGPLLLFFVALGLVGYFVFDAANGFVNADVVDGRVTGLQTDIGDLEWQADQLSALVAFLDSDEYIERTAREELGLVRPGEEAIAIEAPAQPGLRIVRSPWWANLLPEPDPRPSSG
jgi:cell division protein FtsB